MAATALAYEPSLVPHPRGGARTATAPRAIPEPAPRPRHRQAQQPLEVVRRRSRVRFTTLGFALVVAVMAAIALVGPMVVNVAGMRVEWRLAQLDDRQDTLVSERAALSARAAALGSTPRILEEAQKLGMQSATHVDYVRLPGTAAARTTSTGTDGGGTQHQP
jgi:cell division protein FtsL